MMIELSKEQELALKKKWEDDLLKAHVEKLAAKKVDAAPQAVVAAKTAPAKKKNSYFNKSTWLTLFITFCFSVPVILIVLKGMKGG